MSEAFRVEMRTVDGGPAALGAAGPLTLTAVRGRVDSDYEGDPAVSSEIVYEVELQGNASDEALDELLSYVDRIAEIPNSLRRATPVTLGSRAVRGRSAHAAG